MTSNSSTGSFLGRADASAPAMAAGEAAAVGEDDDMAGRGRRSEEEAGLGSEAR
jgi:hypothetical protein